MDDFLLALLQLLGEIVLQALAEMPWDVTLAKRGRHRESGLDDAVVPCALLSIAVGVAVGGISLTLFPATFIHLPWLRAANLAVSPTLTGLLSSFLARRRRRSTPGTSPRSHFLFSFLFSLGFALVRFLCAK